MADDSQTCCTVETPSRLMLFYPDSTPCVLTTPLPTRPISKPVGQHVTLGRSGSADIRLNDERMSRLYAALWHDGKDPFVFRVSNLSERKMLIVDGVMLRYKEEAEVKDGSSLTLDFLQLKARVCGGDYVASLYQVTLVKNVVMSPPPMPPAAAAQPPEGKCLMPPRKDSVSGRDLSSVFSCSDNPYSTSLGKAEDVVSKLLTCLQTASLDSGPAPGMHAHPTTTYPDPADRQGRSLDSAMSTGASFLSGAPGYAPYARRYSDVGVEYELPENLGTMGLGNSSLAEPPSGLSTVSMSPSVYTTGNKLSLNIPPPPQPACSYTLSAASTASATTHQQQNNLFRLSSASHASSQAPEQHSTTGEKQRAGYAPTPQQHQRPFQLCSLSPPAHNPLSAANTAKTDFSCWFNMETSPSLKPQNGKAESVQPAPDLPEIAQRVQDALVDCKKRQVCAACSYRGGNEGSGFEDGLNINMAATTKPVPDVTQKMALADMVAPRRERGEGRRSPVENAEWDTDDPNINCYMK